MNLITMNVIINLLLLLTIHFISTLSHNELQMIVDVINSYEEPIDVTTNVCWGKAPKIKLMNQLRLLKLPKTVRFIINNEICEDKSSTKNLMNVVDYRCPNWEEILLTANSCNKIKQPNRWFIIGAQKQHNEILAELEFIKISIDAEIILSQQYVKSFQLYMPYRTGLRNKNWILEYYGTWDPKHGLNKSKSMSVYSSTRRKDLSGEPLTISVVIRDSVIKTEYLNISDSNNYRYSPATVSFLLLLPIYNFMNATKVIIYTDVQGYLVNGTYNGMVGHLARGEAELGGTAILITKERLPVLEYMNYLASTSTKFVFREPSLSSQHNLFLLPFKPLVWCSIIGLIFILIITIFTYAKWEYTKFRDDVKFDGILLKPNLSDAVILVISAIVQQGTSTELKGTLGRIVMFILFSTFVFLHTSYAASIVVLLQSSSSQIQTLSDLLNSRLELGAEDTFYNRYYLAIFTDAVKVAQFGNKKAHRRSKVNFMSLEDGVRKFQKEAFAFNMNTGLGYKLVEQYFYEHEKCGLREISYYQDLKYWQICRKDSPYKEIIKIGSLRTQEHGLNMRVNNLVFAKKPACIVKGGNVSSVTMIDFYPVLLGLLYGLIVAANILFLEILVYRKQYKIIIPYHN